MIRHYQCYRCGDEKFYPFVDQDSLCRSCATLEDKEYWQIAESSEYSEYDEILESF